MKLHSVDYVSLVFGAFFVVVAGIFLSTGFDAFDVSIQWIGPAILVIIGIAFLLPSRRKRPELPATPATTAEVVAPEVEAAKDELFPSPRD